MTEDLWAMGHCVIGRCCWSAMPAIVGPGNRHGHVCAAVCLNPAQYAGHSLRAGMATSAAAAGAEERAIMRQTRHKSVNMVRRYIRDGEVFRDNAAGRLGL